MSRKEKLLQRLLQRPKDFTFEELSSLLGMLGYREITYGKTSGSRCAFISGTKCHIIRLHRPHPDKILKMYQIDYIIEELRKESLL